MKDGLFCNFYRTRSLAFQQGGLRVEHRDGHRALPFRQVPRDVRREDIDHRVQAVQFGNVRFHAGPLARLAAIAAVDETPSFTARIANGASPRL